MVLPHPSIVSDEEGRGLGALTNAHQLGGNWGENSARREESKNT